MAQRPPPIDPQTPRRLFGLLWRQRHLLLPGLAGLLIHNGAQLVLLLLVEHFIAALNPNHAPIPRESLDLANRFLFALFPSLAHLGEGHGDLVTAMRGVLFAIVVATTVMALGLMLQNYFISAGVQTFLRDLRNRLYRQTTALSLDYFEQERTGQVLAHTTTDVAALQDYLMRALLNFLGMGMLVISTLVLMLLKSPIFTLYSLTVMPLVAGLFWAAGRKVRSAGQESLGRLGELSTQLTETIVGMPVVKAFAREEAGFRQFERENKAAYKAELVKVRVRVVMVALSTVIVTLGMVGLFLLGMERVQAGDLSGPALATFILLLYKFSDSANKFGGYWTGYQEMLAGADRIFHYLDEDPSVADAPGATALAPGSGEVAFEGVRFRYRADGQWALDGVDFAIAPGRTVALVGSSGSGKSSAAKLLLRFYDPQEGVVRVDGMDIRGVTQASLRARMAFVPQSTMLFSGTIRSNIRFGREGASDDEILAAAKQANAHEFILALPQGYETAVGERGITLSGGQAQRIAIARALLKDPSILILDEATSALDSQAEQEVQRALTRLMKGRTTLVIAHRLSTIQAADEILVLDQGKIVQRGTHAELFAQEGLYREFYQVSVLG